MEYPPRPPRQYKPATFGQGFDPDTVDGRAVMRQRAQWAARRREREAEKAFAEYAAKHEEP